MRDSSRMVFEVLQVSTETVFLRMPARSPRPLVVALERIDQSAHPLIQPGAVLSALVGPTEKSAFKDIRIASRAEMQAPGGLLRTIRA